MGKDMSQKIYLYNVKKFVISVVPTFRLCCLLSTGILTGSVLFRGTLRLVTLTWCSSISLGDINRGLGGLGDIRSLVHDLGRLELVAAGKFSNSYLFLLLIIMSHENMLHPPF